MFSLLSYIRNMEKQKARVICLIKNPKVLILTAHYGNGHVQVAKTLEQTFRQKELKMLLYATCLENHIHL